MKLPLKERFLSWAVVIALAMVLVALARMQYQWSLEVSEATSARMQASLESSMMSFRQALYSELAAICLALEVNSETGAPDGWSRYAQRYQQWSHMAAHPNLVANVFVWEWREGTPSTVVVLNQRTNQFEPANWPVGFGTLERRLSEMSSMSMLLRFAGRGRFPDRGNGPPGGLGLFPNPKFFRRGPPDAARSLGPPDGNRRPGFPGGPPPGGPPGSMWMMEQNIPALVHRVVPAADPDPVPASPRSVDWVVIELNEALLRQHLLPELAQRYFGGPEGLTYQVAIVGGNGARRVIYSSDSEFAKQDIAAADAMLDVFGPPSPGPPRSGMNVPAGPANEIHDREWFEERPRFELFGRLRLIPIRENNAEQDWQLVVKHRAGSLEAAVARMRHRNLAISFGVLLVLAATTGMIVLTTQRARKLAKLQMDFVAAVSHELRTPLAVISSAAENIADGVVEGKQQLARYGSVIRDQARQLITLVEQVLLFAATRENGHRYSPRLVQVTDILHAALRSSESIISAAGCAVERTMEANLPPILVDPLAVSQCLQNLITNAVKYGGENRWIGIRAKSSDMGGHREVQISIEDKGAGIGSAEQRRIFEPFYRSPSATAAQIRGTGLGLALAKEIAEAMGGRLTVSSELGVGSCFTLHLPVADTSEPGADTAVSMAAGAKAS